MSDIHTFNSGVRVHAGHLIQVQRDRYAMLNLHEPVEEEWVARLIATLNGGPGLFVDIGAAIGYYCFLVHRLNPQVELHAYEPDAANRDRLRENLELNGLPEAPSGGPGSITIHDQAIAAKAGTGALAGEGFVAYLTPARSEGRPVPTTTISDIAQSLARPIDLLKMDIQGGEADALRGAEDALRARRIRNWIVGTHSPELHQFCIQTFERFSHRILFQSMRVEHQPDGMVIAATGRR